MAAVAPASSSAVFEIKSATISGVAVILRTTDLDVLAAELEERLGPTPDVFDHDPVVIDLAAIASEAASASSLLDFPLDFPSLVALLRRFRMQPVAVRGGSPAQMEAARAAGLGEAPDITPTRAEPRVETMVQEIVREVVREVPVEVRVEVPRAVPTMIVDKPLRSGQQVYAKGGDLIVLAAVNVGAEVIADGHIHVYAPLRGKAIAGAKGNAEARVFALSMEAELVAIAGTYRTTENPLPADVVGKPAQVRLEGDRMVFEPFN